MSVLDAIDTTVTLEWGQTRTVATLTRLGGRTATVTALRVPEPGVDCFLRLEGDGPHDTIAIDGQCVALRDSEWGETQIDVMLIRVGTTTSATALRDFIEQHDIQKGGSVAVGKNRDNPDVKRFVYTLGGMEGIIRPPSQPNAPVRQGSTSPHPAVPPTSLSRSALPVHDTIETNPHMAPRSAAVVPQSHEPAYAPRGPTPAPIAGLDVGEVDLELRQMLDMLDQRAAGRPSDPTVPQPLGHASGAPASDDMHLIDAALTNGGGTDWQPDDGRSFQPESQEAIIVETVAAGDNQPRPVMPTPKLGFVARLFGRGKAQQPTQQTQIQANPAEFVAEPARSQDPTSLWDTGPRQPPGARGGMVSGSLLAVQQLFAVDQAVRVDRAISYEAGKKKKLPGVALRLSESKIRVRGGVMPALYERIIVHLPPPSGGKEPVSIRCEVLRIRSAEVEGGEQSFDAKLTSGNEPQTMIRLRQLMSEMQPIMGEGP